MIREFVRNDLNAIIDIALNFENENSFFAKIGGVNEKILTKTLNYYLDKNALKIWVSEINNKIVAALGIIIAQDYLSGEIGLNEMFWYAKREVRGNFENVHLYNEVEKYAKKINAKYLIMFHFSNLKSLELEKFYKKNGFKKFQVQYLKNFF